MFALPGASTGSIPRGCRGSRTSSSRASVLWVHLDQHILLLPRAGLLRHLLFPHQAIVDSPFGHAIVGVREGEKPYAGSWATTCGLPGTWRSSSARRSAALRGCSSPTTTRSSIPTTWASTTPGSPCSWSSWAGRAPSSVPIIGATIVVWLEYFMSLADAANAGRLSWACFFIAVIMYFRGGVVLWISRSSSTECQGGVQQVSVMEALRVENLTKYFGGVKVLEDIAFEVPRWGAPGRHRAERRGQDDPYQSDQRPDGADPGRIFYFGEDITDLPTHARAHIGQARSYQLCSLFLNLTSGRTRFSLCTGLGSHATASSVLSDGTRR